MKFIKELTPAEKWIYGYFVGGAIVATIVILLATPEEFGKIEQGRTIAFDEEKRVITLISDANHDPFNPAYTLLPPRQYQLPDPGMTGPAPRPGGQMKVDIAKNEITIFDKATQSFKTVPYTLIDQKVVTERRDPLIWDREKRRAKTFPQIDREAKTITIWQGGIETLTTFSLPDEYFALPDYTWRAGDEVRIYYSEEGQARKFMNITLTDIFKR